MSERKRRRVLVLWRFPGEGGRSVGRRGHGLARALQEAVQAGQAGSRGRRAGLVRPTEAGQGRRGQALAGVGGGGREAEAAVAASTGAGGHGPRRGAVAARIRQRVAVVAAARRHGRGRAAGQHAARRRRRHAGLTGARRVRGRVVRREARRRQARRREAQRGRVRRVLRVHEEGVVGGLAGLVRGGRLRAQAGAARAAHVLQRLEALFHAL